VVQAVCQSSEKLKEKDEETERETEKGRQRN